MNNCSFVGRLTKDVELRYTPTGIPTCTFTIAVDREFKNASGEVDTDFVQIVVWRKLAELVAKYLSKGKMASITGRLQTRKYDAKDGVTRYISEIVADSVRFLSPKNVSYTSTPVDPLRPTGTDDLPF